VLNPLIEVVFSLSFTSQFVRIGMTARPLDTRHVVAIGRRLFEDGGLEPLEALIDQIADQLGREPAYELVVLWTPIVEGDDGVP
jgi:hypothetical protein